MSRKGVSLLVRNLSSRLRAEDVRYEFERFGKVRDVYIPRDFHTGRPRGFCFVEYLDRRDAEDARDEMDRRVLDGREIAVIFAQEQRKTGDEMRRKERVKRDTRRSRSRSPRRYSRRRSRSRSPRRGGSRSPRRHDRRSRRSVSRSPRRRSRSRSSSPVERRDASRSKSPRRDRSRSRSRSPVIRSASRSRTPDKYGDDDKHGRKYSDEEVNGSEDKVTEDTAAEGEAQDAA